MRFAQMESRSERMERTLDMVRSDQEEQMLDYRALAETVKKRSDTTKLGR